MLGFPGSVLNLKVLNPLGPQSSACSLRALQMPWSLLQAKESYPYLFNV